MAGFLSILKNFGPHRGNIKDAVSYKMPDDGSYCPFPNLIKELPHKRAERMTDHEQEHHGHRRFKNRSQAASGWLSWLGVRLWLKPGSHGLSSSPTSGSILMVQSLLGIHSHSLCLSLPLLCSFSLKNKHINLKQVKKKRIDPKTI